MVYLVVRASLRRFSQLVGHVACILLVAGHLEQERDEDAESVIAKSEALVLQDPGVGALGQRFLPALSSVYPVARPGDRHRRAVGPGVGRGCLVASVAPSQAFFGPIVRAGVTHEGL